MFDGLGTELNSIIDNLCSKFGTTVDALIPELCKFKMYQSVGYITAFSMLGIFVLVCMFVIYRTGQKNDMRDECLAINMFLAIVLFVFIGCIAYQTYYLIIWKNAPTGAAVNYVIQQLKNR